MYDTRQRLPTPADNMLEGSVSTALLGVTLDWGGKKAK